MNVTYVPSASPNARLVTELDLFRVEYNAMLNGGDVSCILLAVQYGIDVVYLYVTMYLCYEQYLHYPALPGMPADA